VPRELLFQFLATVNLVLGAWYIHWRWTASLNWDALWFALPLVAAETLAYVGFVLFTANLWKTWDYPRQPPPRSIGECVLEAVPERPISVDVFIATYGEDPELVRLSVRDAKKLAYPHSIDLRVHVLDDGRRPQMRRVAVEEEVEYVTRDGNIGFKAGNLRHAMEQTSGDFILICDADTRPFPSLLENTLGYFRDPDVAWVQTPQWFYDIPEGRSLPAALGGKLGRAGACIGRAVETTFGPVRVAEDPFANDPQMFYDVIQRRRNWANASFCCGAGSVHRREAVMQVALRQYAGAIESLVAGVTGEIRDEEIRRDLSEAMTRQVALETEVTPYKFHVSEDIYTSIALHSDRARHWKSVLHPWVESKMLSPQDLQTWIVQRFKYAAGTLDILLHDNPLFRRGLRWPQRLMYAGTFWAYLGCVWNVVFLAAPIVFLFTGVTPVSSYSGEFFKRIFPFLLTSELAMMVGTWGISGWLGKTSYLYFFPTNFRALWAVLRGRKIAFPTTPKMRQEGNFLRLVVPQLTVIALTAGGILYAGVRLALGMPTNLAGLLTNAFWGVNNILALQRIVRAAFWRPEESVS
jgi:cellulose synthase (UDP-forming)